MIRLVVLAALSTSVHAGLNGAQSQQPVFRAGIDLVQVDAVVLGWPAGTATCRWNISGSYTARIRSNG
jgi:hypothetical protein